jgi:uncharacterized RDD family membrane protein YckC
MKKPTFKRIVAYIIDVLIVTIIATGISSIPFLNPTMDKYNETYEQYMEYLKNGLSVEEANNILNSEEYQSITYDMTYYGRYTSLITLVVSFSYFVVFQYFTKGYTGGKKLLKIKVEAEDGKLKFYKLLLRGLIINNLLTSSLNLILLFIGNKMTFGQFNMFIEVLQMGLLFTTFGMILYRQDGRGLHDLIAGTRVIDTKVKE